MLWTPCTFRSSPSWNFTQCTLAVTGVSEQSVFPTFKDQAVKQSRPLLGKKVEMDGDYLLSQTAADTNIHWLSSERINSQTLPSRTSYKWRHQINLHIPVRIKAWYCSVFWQGKQLDVTQLGALRIFLEAPCFFSKVPLFLNSRFDFFDNSSLVFPDTRMEFLYINTRFFVWPPRAPPQHTDRVSPEYFHQFAIFPAAHLITALCGLIASRICHQFQKLWRRKPDHRSSFFFRVAAVRFLNLSQ